MMMLERRGGGVLYALYNAPSYHCSPLRLVVLPRRPNGLDTAQSSQLPLKHFHPSRTVE